MELWYFILKEMLYYVVYLLMQEPPDCMFVKLRPEAADNLPHFAWLVSISNRVGDVASS